MESVPIHLAVEDILSETLLRVLLDQSGRDYAVGKCFQRGGFGYLKKTARGFNRAAKGTPIIMLTDLDRAACPPALIADWLPMPRHPNFLFRVAVHEVESWILADREAFARFLGIRQEKVPLNPDEIIDPKVELIRLSQQTRNRELRRAIIPPPRSVRTQGPDYNGRLSGFVLDHWSAERASSNSPSLYRTLEVVRRFRSA